MINNVNHVLSVAAKIPQFERRQKLQRVLKSLNAGVVALGAPMEAVIVRWPLMHGISAMNETRWLVYIFALITFVLGGVVGWGLCVLWRVKELS